MTTLTFAIALLTSPAPQASSAQFSLVSDKRLAVTKSFDSSLLHVTEFLETMSKETGVSLKVAKNASDLKLDIYVDDQPLNKTLDAVATALNCEWISDPGSKGYKLEQSAVQVNRERIFIEAIEKNRRRKAELEVWAQRFLAANLPPPSTGKDSYPDKFLRFEEAMKPLRVEYGKRYSTLSDPERRDFEDKLNALNEARSDSIAPGRLLNHLSESEMKAFWAGQVFCASDQPGSKFPLRPGDADNNHSVTYSGIDSNGRSAVLVPETYSLLRWNPEQFQVQSMRTLHFPGNHGGNGPYSHVSPGTQRSSLYTTTSDFLTEQIQKLPFYQDLLPWLDEEKTPKLFTEKVKIKVEQWDSPWTSHRRRLGDHLRYFHLTFGVPVVALADRSCTYEITNLNRGHTTAEGYVADYMKRGHVFLKKSGDYLVARNSQFWEHRRHEAPEATWKAVEERVKRPKFGIHDAIWVTSQLGKHQIGSFAMSYPMKTFRLPVDKSNYSILRYLRSLPSLLVDQATSPEGVSLDGTDPAFLAQTIWNIAFNNGTISQASMLPLAKQGVASLNTRGIRLYIKISETQYSESGSDVTESGVIVNGASTDVTIHKDVTYKAVVNSIETSFGWDKNRQVSTHFLLPKS